MEGVWKWHADIAAERWPKSQIYARLTICLSTYGRIPPLL